MYRFKFEFVDEAFVEDDDEINVLVYYFSLNISDEQVKELQTALYEDDSAYINFFWNMEEYGVHDFFTEGDEELIGYSSNEIKSEKYDEVINKWYEWFLSNGYNPGNIEKLTSEEYEKKFFLM